VIKRYLLKYAKLRLLRRPQRELLAMTPLFGKCWFRIQLSFLNIFAIIYKLEMIMLKRINNE